MNFGLYLVKNGVINEETYLNSLEEQYSSLPSMIEVLRKKCQVSDAKVLEIVQKQNENNSSFLEAARNVLDDQTLQEAIDAQNKSIKTIGEILVDNNLVDLVNIQQQVEAYSKDQKETNSKTIETTSEPSPTQESAPAQPSASSSDGDTEVSQAAIDSMKEIFGDDSPEVKEMEAQLAAAQANDSTPESEVVKEEHIQAEDASTDGENFYKAEHDLDHDFIPELIIKFNAKEIVKLSKGIKELANTEDKKSALEVLNKRLHTILGAAKLSGAKILAESVKTLENFTKSLSPDDLNDENIEKIYQFFSLLVKLRNHIEQEKSEKGFFEESNRQDTYNNLINSLQ